MIYDAPRGVFVGVVVVRAVAGLEGAGDEEEEGHEEGAGEEGGAAAEAVEVEDCGEGHEDVEDVLSDYDDRYTP